MTPVIAIPRLWILRSDALIALKQFDAARRVLQAAQAAAVRQGARGWLWRIHLALGKVYQMQAKGAEADQEYNTARSIITELTDSIQVQALRVSFWEQALGMLPAQRAVSARKAIKSEFDGLTVREREVAALIARGESNREIAAGLVVSERTIESHVTNILTKLGFSSRARIAVWAADKGLVKPSK
jgi:non-specific serine/threonine protein kinase